MFGEGFWRQKNLSEGKMSKYSHHGKNQRLCVWGGMFRAGERSKHVFGVNKMGKWTLKGWR